MIIKTTSVFRTRKLAEDERAEIWEESVPNISESLNSYLRAFTARPKLLRAESDLKIEAALVFMLEI